MVDRGVGGAAQVLDLVLAADAGGLEQAVEERGDLGAALGARAVVVLAADDGSAERALDGVVVEGYPRVIEEADQAGPEAEHVLDGLAQRALPRRALGVGPVAQAVDQRAQVDVAR